MINMGTTLYGKMKWGLLKFDLNYWAGETLRWLCWGLKKKYGLYAPLKAEDCKIVARILRNKAHLFEVLRDDHKHSLQEMNNLFLVVNGEKDYMNDDDTIKWMKELADFFDKIDGLVDLNGYNED